MGIDELKKERDKINEIKEDFIDKLLRVIEENKSEIDEYKKELKYVREKLKNTQDELIVKDNEIEELRNQVIKVENELYSVRNLEQEGLGELISELKEALLEGDDMDIEELIEEILENIEVLEKKISYEDMILLIYCCYFYDRLDELLSKCLIAHSYYSEKSNESKLLKILKEEQGATLYRTISECTQKFIKNNNNIFNNFDIRTKEILFKFIKDISYKYFDRVYKDENIDKEENIINIKCWVKVEKGLSCILVNAQYSILKDRIYLPDKIINEQNLNLDKEKREVLKNIDNIVVDKNEKNKNRIKNCVSLLYQSFNSKTDDSIKMFMIKKANEKEINLLEEILKQDISPKTISLNEAYTILIISEFYGLLSYVIEKSYYLNTLYKAKCTETELISIMHSEIKIKCDTVIERPLSIFLENNIEELRYIDDTVKNKVISLLDNLYYDVFLRISEDENTVCKCHFDDETIYYKRGFIKVNDNKYIFISGRGCHKCNTLYISKKRYKKIRNKHFFDDITGTIDDKVEDKDINKNQYIEWYNSVLNAFSKNNIGRALTLYNRHIFNVEIINSLNRKQVITLMFIGYLIKHKVNSDNTKEVENIRNNYNLGNSIETILYDRLSENTYLNDYIEQYSSALENIDIKVKQDILKEIALIGDKINKPKVTSIATEKNETSSKTNDFEGNSLNAESVIKKMGYSTSLNREVRWNILKNKAVPKLGINKVIGHLNFLVNMNKNRSVMKNAVSEWCYDLNRLEREFQYNR